MTRPLPKSQVEMSVMPKCDICKFVEHAPEPWTAVVDGPTVPRGQWGYMCPQHYQSHAAPTAQVIGSHLVPYVDKVKMKGE